MHINTWRLIILSLFSTLIISVLHAQQITGIISDNETGEPLIGCTITLLQSNTGKPSASITAGLNGGFIFKDLNPGNYQLSTHYLGYITKDTNVSVNNANQQINIHLNRDTKSTLNEVTVTTQRNNGSDRTTFLADKLSPNIQNSVSARTIEISPDLSVASVTQRVSGVSLERSTNGEGQYAIVRGMDKRYNYTLVNGIKIPSPDNKNRYIPLDIFPADLLDRLEVTKALTPNMEGDAIGGVVNMIMKDATYKFSVNANAALGYSASLSNNDFKTFDRGASLDHSPRYTNGNDYNATLKDVPNNPFTYGSKQNPLASLFGLSLGGRVFNNKLGILVAGSYQNNYRNVNSVFFGTETDRNAGYPNLQDIEQRYYSIQQRRTGLHAKLDYAINANNSINLYAGYFNLAKNEYRYASDTNLVLGRTIPGSGRVENQYRTYHDEQQIFNLTLNGKHNIGNFSINWSAVYSKATDNRPDQASLNLVTGVSVDPTTGKFVQADLNLDQYSYREWQYNSDEDKSGYLNFNYKSLIGDVKADWSLGGMYRNKTRNSFYDSYTLRPDPGIQQYDGDINHNTFYIFNPQGNATNPLNYDATENVGAAYAMLHLTYHNFQLTGGARYENTDLSWNSAVPETVEGKTGSVKYYDVLPSANLKYTFANGKQDIRASYYSAISRPNFYEIIPHIGGDPYADYQERGNPNLKRSIADNYDVRYELFLGGLDQILVGAFYKNIKNPIEFALEDVGTNTYYQPDNFGTARNYGFEADITKYFRWFGIRANYTFTDSKITTLKSQRISTDSGQTALEVNQTRPLQGQSKHIANISLLYKDDNKTGLNAQLAFTYTSKRINTVSQFFNDDIWQKGFAQMDFSVEKKFAKKWFVYAKVNNILNTPYELEIPVANNGSITGVPYQAKGQNIFVRKDTYGVNYLLGVKFKM